MKTTNLFAILLAALVAISSAEAITIDMVTGRQPRQRAGYALQQYLCRLGGLRLPDRQVRGHGRPVHRVPQRRGQGRPQRAVQHGHGQAF